MIHAWSTVIRAWWHGDRCDRRRREGHAGVDGTRPAAGPGDLAQQLPKDMDKLVYIGIKWYTYIYIYIYIIYSIYIYIYIYKYIYIYIYLHIYIYIYICMCMYYVVLYDIWWISLVLTVYFMSRNGWYWGVNLYPKWWGNVCTTNRIYGWWFEMAC